MLATAEPAPVEEPLPIGSEPEKKPTNGKWAKNTKPGKSSSSLYNQDSLDTSSMDDDKHSYDDALEHYTAQDEGTNIVHPQTMMAFADVRLTDSDSNTEEKHAITKESQDGSVGQPLQPSSSKPRALEECWEEIALLRHGMLILQDRLNDEGAFFFSSRVTKLPSPECI